MNAFFRRALFGLACVVSGAGCELAVDVNPTIHDASLRDAPFGDCSLCADVSADASYDAPDVTIYGIQPGDAGGAVDAGLDAKGGKRE